MANNFHTSVLLQEAVDFLQVKSGEKYIDATLGGGGHTEEILNRGGVVLGLDVDEEAIQHVKQKLGIANYRLRIVQGNFRDIGQIAHDNTLGDVAGILFDLGVSSYQINTSERGFSFNKDAALDMRMDASLQVTAADLVNGLSKGELYELFIKYGEETYARKIINHILIAREMKKIETTGELAEIVERIYPKEYHKIHPATKVFQALRIAVNDEMNNLRTALPHAAELLQPGGRLVVISFHSLEDRIVKHSFLEFEMKHMGKGLTKHPISPSDSEEGQNRRSRSAKLRVFEKAG